MMKHPGISNDNSAAELQNLWPATLSVACKLKVKKSICWLHYPTEPAVIKSLVNDLMTAGSVE